MFDVLDKLLAALERGQVSRRDAVRCLAGLLAAAAAAEGPRGAAAVSPTFHSIGLNHVALRVADVPRSRDFYGKHLGLRVLRDSPSSCFLGAGGNQFVALFRGERAGLDHYCYTVEDYQPDRAVERLRAVGLEPRREENRVYFDDADGLTVQVTGVWDDYPGRRSD